VYSICAAVLALPFAIAAAAAANAAHVSADTVARSHEIVAGPPTDLSVTVYRDPGREEGSLDLDDLEGFALIRETRLIHVPAGTSRVRFEGVADGIEPASAIVTGFPGGVIEKDRDAHLLSPSSLVESTVGKTVVLVRSNRKNGTVERVPGKIVSSSDGVVFQTEAGIEALRCSGLPETFTFSGVKGLSATPTLSVRVRTRQPLTQLVTLSYLARGFDWAANYTATLSADGTTMDLGAWVTLANGNGVGFPAAHTQIVAGRLNRETAEIEPIDIGGPILAECWPQGSTSSAPEFRLQLDLPEAANRMYKRALPVPMSMPIQEVMVTGQRVTQEQLGDLKLYRVPERTTVASRQSKQVRLLDRLSIPIHRLYVIELEESLLDAESQRAASIRLQTRNNAANHLGLPLPAGSVAILGPSARGALLLNMATLGDLAVDEDVEIKAGTSYDVQVKDQLDRVDVDPGQVKEIPLVPGVGLRWSDVEDARHVEVSNAHASAVQIELRLRLAAGARVVRADHPVGKRNGQPVFRLMVPANGLATVRYQTAQVIVQPVRNQ
jgi:hypothetical protein